MHDLRQRGERDARREEQWSGEKGEKSERIKTGRMKKRVKTWEKDEERQQGQGTRNEWYLKNRERHEENHHMRAFDLPK